jgi:hypothetical protein
LASPIFYGSVQSVVAVIMAVSVSACVGHQRYDTIGVSRSPNGWESVPPDRAAVRFDGPDAPAVVAARQRFDQDGGRLYDIALANKTLDPGENRVILATRGSEDRSQSVEPDLAAFDLTPDVIGQNFDFLLKGARRTSTPAIRRNRYGPFHFMSADYPGSSQCVYAWQELEQTTMHFAGTGSATSLQFRFCDPDRSPEDIVAMFEQIVIDL